MKKDKPCFAHMEGECTAGKACLHSHDPRVINEWAKAHPDHSATVGLKAIRTKTAAAAKQKAAEEKKKAEAAASAAGAKGGSKGQPKAKAKASPKAPTNEKVACWYHMFHPNGCSKSKDCRFFAFQDRLRERQEGII